MLTTQIVEFAVVLLAGLTPAAALLNAPVPHPPIVKPADDTRSRRLGAQSLPPIDTIYYFDQLIDHNDPSKGTFKQRYWHTAQFYKAGGPVILFNAGEVNAEPFVGYLTTSTLSGLVAQRFSGVPIVLEHRFFGLSNPYPNLNEDSLKYLTIQQSIEDNVYFANNVVLPQINTTAHHPTDVPWILIGGSYPGALVSWTMVAHPEVFWIGYASSAVVQAQLDFWQYFLPIAENMPKNCSADISAVIEYMDTVFNGNNQTAQGDFKTRILGWSGYDNLFVAEYLRSWLWSWQDMQPYTGPGAAFYQFCDALEVKNGVSAPAAGWGLDNTITAWNKYIFGGSAVAPQSTTPPAPQAADDFPVDDPVRSWTWLICNELGFVQDGPPVGQRAIVSRLLTPQTERVTCNSDFPTTFPDSQVPAPDIAGFNQKYQGWSVRAKRLFFANGRQDPWRELTVSAINSTTSSTNDQPIGFSNGFHCSDLITDAGLLDPTVGDVQNKFFGYVATWLSQFRKI